MVVQADQEPAEVDPATLAPLCHEAEFAQEINELVADEAPRLFAVVQEYGERADGRVAAWAWRSRTAPRSSGWIAAST